MCAKYLVVHGRARTVNYGDALECVLYGPRYKHLEPKTTRVCDMAPKRVLFAVVRQKLARLGFGSVHELADAWEADVRGAEFSPEELEVFRFVVRQARVTAKKRPI